MQKVYTIKATYKDKTYVIKGYFPHQNQIKQEILNRKIKDLTQSSQFQLQYPEGISNLQEAYQNCNKYDKTTFKINICKKKRNKNRQSFRKSVQNSEQVGFDSSILNLHPRIDWGEDKGYTKSGFLKENSAQSENNSDLQATAEFQPTENSKSGNQTLKNQELNSELPNFDISQILEKPPLQPENQISGKNQNQIAQPEQIIEQNILPLQTTHTYPNSQAKSSQNCKVPSSDKIEVQTTAKKYSQLNLQKRFEQLSRQLESSILTKITEKLESDFKKKIEETEFKLKEYVALLESKSIQQASQINILLNQNQSLKQMIKNHQANAKILEASMTNAKQNIQLYSDKMKTFQKDFKLINQINFELQNNYIMLDHKIEALAKEFSSEKIKPQNQVKMNQQKQEQAQQIPNLLNGNSSQAIKAANPLVHQPKSSDIQPQELKNQNSLPKEQIQKLFANPKFQGDDKNEDEIPKKKIKPLDGSIEECEKITVFKVGEAYQPQLKIKNTGSQKWPAQVFIFEKESKRTHKIPSLKPSQEYIFTDDIFQVGERQGQNIQIKYQVYYEQKGQKMYIGLPISIFLKVKKSSFEVDESSESQQIDNEDESNKMAAMSINEDKLNRSRVEVQGYGKKKLEDVEDEIKKSQQFIRMINEKKRKLDIGHKTTKDIKAHLQAMGITETNFGQCDSEIIEEIIRNVQVIDLMKR